MNVKILENKKQERELSNADHRLIGQQLDLFSINEEVGIGLVLWHPKGTIVRKIIRDFWEEEHLKNGYQLVCTPHIARGELWNFSFTYMKGFFQMKIQSLLARSPKGVKCKVNRIQQSGIKFFEGHQHQTVKLKALLKG